jgi:hypothetical protein
MRLRFALPLLVASPLWAASPARPPAPEECRREDRIELNLTAWKASLKRAETSKRRDEVLGELKLSLDLGDPETPDDRDNQAGPVGRTRLALNVTLLGLDDFMVRLGPGDLPEHVIQIRYGMEKSDDKAVAYLIQVLRPLETGRWCVLGADLSRQADDQKRLESYELSFVPLLQAKTRAIEVRRVDAQLRHSETYQQYWIVDGFKLRKVFDEQIGSMESVDSGRGTTAKIPKLSLAGGFPRRIELRQVTKHANCEIGADDAPCDDSEPSSSTTFVYDGKRFVRRRE